MAGLTDRDLRRIKRFVETPPRQRTPQLLTPDDDDEGAPGTTDDPDPETERGPETDVERAR
jgi:hypothetical protein